MSVFGAKLIPIRCNTDISANYIDQQTARFIKNLTTSVGANNDSGNIKEGENQLVLKPIQANELYVPVALPAGDNFCIGAKGFPQTNEVYVWVWNSLNNHLIYRINGKDRTHEIVKIDPCFNFKLDPEKFVGECQATLKVIALTNPVTNEKFIRKELYWVDGDNYNGFIAVDDSIATNGFDKVLFPFFNGNYDPCLYTRAGIATPKDCVLITEVTRTDAEIGLNNNLLFQKWFFIVRRTDVWGRVSEWGARSEEYIPGINDCISGSSNLPRCLNLEFDAGDPTINTIEIGWYNCNTTLWHKEITLFLYNETNIGEWWLRTRNTDINYNPVTNKITYKFCRDKECDVIPVDETNRLQNPMPINSQSVIELNKNLGYLNNEDGFNPFPKSLLDKITVNVIPPQAIVDTGLRTITIYVPIYNNFFRYTDGTGLYSSVSIDDGGRFVWGIIGGFPPQAFAQYFENPTQQGFVGYLVGSALAISTQVYMDADGNLLDDPQHNGYEISPFKFTMQKFVFNNVPKGIYIFRLASHLTDPNLNVDFEKTSTTVWGKTPYDKFTFNTNPRTSIAIFNRAASKELIIDVCTEDYDTLNQNEMLVIADLINDHKAQWGYIYETDKNGANENPVELAEIIVPPSKGTGSGITDHNGHYWVAGDLGIFYISFMNECQKITIEDAIGGPVIGSVVGAAINQNIIIDHIIAYADYTLIECNRVLITGRLSLTGTNIGVSNTLVTLTRGQSAITNDNGDFTIIAHDEVAASIRIDEVIIGIACGYTAVGGGCVQPIQITFTKCSSCTTRVINLNFQPGLVLEFITQKGLLDGGSYPFTIWGWDWLGRATYAQPLPNINIPSIIQSHAVAPSQVIVNVDPTATFPQDIKYISFGIGEETTIEKYLSWIVDRFDFIDNTGAINNIAPTQIKIYYGSVIEFNSINNFNTTTNWDFIPEGKNIPVINDKVQFFINGDGKFFTKTIIGLVKYDQTGQYFLIDYTSDLKDLQQNALIRLIRPKTCIGTEPIFEVCGAIDVVNGKALQNTITLKAYDTYYLTRQIPVPAPVQPDAKRAVSITTTVDGVTTTYTPPPVETVNELRIVGFRFPHSAPSNFWGEGCNFIGRVNAKNPYEARLRHLWQIALSGAVSINGQLNYLQYFEAKKKTDFDVPTSAGGITGAIPEIGVVFCICAYDSYLVGYNDNLGRVNENGTFQAPSIPNEFGKPQRKQGDTYGCQLADKNTIKSRNGLIMWIDRSRAEAVQSNYAQILSLSKDETLIEGGVKRGKCDAWMRAKIKQVQSDPNSYFMCFIDPIANKYLVSVFSLTDKDYINDETTYGTKLNETAAFDIQTRDLKEFLSYTPENAAYLDGDLLSVQLFTFKGAQPYSHYNVNTNNLYNTFYGIKCKSVVRPIFNMDTFKKKIFNSMAVYCENKIFFAENIVTEAKQQSRTLIEHWKKADYFYYAPFLCDLKTLPDPNVPEQTSSNVLTDGDKLYGCWTEINFVGDPSKNDQYCEILGIIVEVQAYEKTGLNQ